MGRKRNGGIRAAPRRICAILATNIQAARRPPARLGEVEHGAVSMLDPRSRLIMLHAMYGFANFGSLGIMIAGLATMCAEKRDEVVSPRLKSIVSGTLTTCLLSANVGVLS
jgi:nucleoside permease NupC